MCRGFYETGEYDLVGCGRHRVGYFLLDSPVNGGTFGTSYV